MPLTRLKITSRYVFRVFAPTVVVRLPILALSKVINGFMAKADGKDKLTALVQVIGTSGITKMSRDPSPCLHEKDRQCHVSDLAVCMPVLVCRRARQYQEDPGICHGCSKGLQDREGEATVPGPRICSSDLRSYHRPLACRWWRRCSHHTLPSPLFIF